MQCPQCGKTGFVTISGKRFCTACGAKLGGSATSATPGANMSGISGRGDKTIDLRSQAPDDAAARRAALSAGQLQGAPVAGQVLDLRTAAAAEPTTPTPAPVTPGQVITPAAATPAPTPIPAPVAATPPLSLTQVKPATIQKVATAVTPKAAVPATPAAAAPSIRKESVTNPADSIPRSSRITKFTPHPDAAAAAKPVGTLPEAVASQVDAMSTQSAAVPAPTRPQSPALQQALAAAKQSAKPSVVKVGAALAAVAVMVAVVWFQNSPKLAFRTAANKAGINASLPTYVPSSYHQSGGFSASPGQLTLNFTSPNTNTPLTIAQRQSSWDSDSLRDNYVSQQTDNYLAVQGEGLTIYLYGNQANWVNHGVWYQLSGTAKLSREQVIKIAYGL